MKYPNDETGAGGGDEILMDDLCRHDPDAFEQLYRRHQPVLRGVVLRVVNNELDAEDVLQDVFIQIWTRADGYTPEKGKPLGWLITLARRRAIDRLRQRAAYRRATDRFEFEQQRPMERARDSHSVESIAFHDDMRDIVTRALARLPQKQKEVVERAFLDGMSQREIASTMRVPLGTVKTRIELGLRKLSSVLASSRRKIF